MAAPLIVLEAPPWNEFISRVASALSALEERSDAASWERYRVIIAAYKEAKQKPEVIEQKLTERQIHQKVNKDLRAWWLAHGKPELRASFLSHAAMVNETFKDLFCSIEQKLPYWHYYQIANSRLEPAQKEELRAQAEANHARGGYKPPAPDHDRLRFNAACKRCWENRKAEPIFCPPNRCEWRYKKSADIPETRAASSMLRYLSTSSCWGATGAKSRRVAVSRTASSSAKKMISSFSGMFSASERRVLHSGRTEFFSA
jgi:hypothetical protein